ncbi:ATP-binding cassette domain-containing protein [Streptomyces sp. NPDC001941]|uniref:ATP-binding cassette domain-containing protein n=1 Tax=Streptomyces sp. NPDC001941 TaxID=3154659 RepID=UPI00332EE33A
MRLHGVGRRYATGGPWVLRGVGLTVEPGTLVRVEGPNGGGKSTLLRLLAGVDAPTEGRITGRPRTAYVPERFPAALPFTATGYLVHLGRIHGLRRGEAAARAGRWLERFGAAAHARTPLAELSKGSSQKIAVVQALLAEPGLLVLDEAWTGLDGAARAELDRAVRERVAAGGAVVFVDHDPRRLAGAADRVHAVADGRVAARRGAEPEPRVRITASGGRLPLPGDLPGAPSYTRDARGQLLLTVGAQHSDAVLRALLAAEPPWSIRRLDTGTTAPGPTTSASDSVAPGSER